MSSVIDYAPLTLLPQSDTSSPLAAPLSWNLTRAIHMLRLTIADASLRAREEAHQHRHDSNEYWYALGRARGFQKAAAMLRAWTHPEERDVVIEALERQAKLTLDRAQHATTPNTSSFYDAYAWTLDWALSHVRELCAVLD